MRIRVLAAALGSLLLAGPAVADTPDPAIAPAAAPGDDPGKLCISIPVAAMADAFKTFVSGFAASTTPASGAAPSTAAPAGGVAPSTGAPADAAVPSAPAPAQDQSGTAAAPRPAGPALPDKMLVLQAAPC
ncbi:hypothetical protein [Nonomuraea sp. GTA35]|uniref:hypothetical protein n=1 Tax=Nonomuraea sp. GTA35 TaxID=1676746 RepID=UPI0035C21C14